MNILVLAYTISPSKGSEYSVAWNYVKNMSKYHRLTVLYGASGNHMGDCKEMEDYAKSHPNPNVRFVPIYPNRFTNLLNWPNRHNLFVYTFYYAYQQWHKLAYKKAKELVCDEHFDLIHYVGMIGYREPGYLWKLGLPYVWGPISGANNVPKVFFERMPLLSKLKLYIRTIANKYQIRHKKRLKQALKNTNVLLTASSENQRIFKYLHNRDSICLPENCIDGTISLNEKKFNDLSTIRIIVVGRLDANKSVNILLEAINNMDNVKKVHVDIVGDGPLRNSLQEFVNHNLLKDIVTFHGQVPRTKAVEMFDKAHLHVLTSASEGNPTTIWEAMSYGVPTLSFDHCGMHDTLRDGAGILIPIKPKYEDNVLSITRAIEDLINNSFKLKELADVTLARANEYTWAKRVELLNRIYSNLCK